SVVDDQGNPITPTPSVTWHSSATAVVDINPTSGSATAVSAGSTPPTHVTITATSDNGVTSNPVDVTVSAAPVFTDRSGQIVISQIYGGGGNNGVTYE